MPNTYKQCPVCGYFDCRYEYGLNGFIYYVCNKCGKSWQD